MKFKKFPYPVEKNHESLIKKEVPRDRLIQICQVFGSEYQIKMKRNLKSHPYLSHSNDTNSNEDCSKVCYSTISHF